MAIIGTSPAQVFMMRSVLKYGTLLLTALPALGDSTINGTGKHAYSANGGWINARSDQPAPPEEEVGDYHLSGNAYGANFGWIDFGDGTPANGIRYGNDSATDHGVNHDGVGNLSGYAYAGNIGWINFG